VRYEAYSGGKERRKKVILHGEGERKVVEMPSGTSLVCRVGASVECFVMNWSRNEGDIRPFLYPSLSVYRA